MKLLTHPLTEQRLRNFRATPSHAVLLVGPRGSGKFSLAQDLAERLLSLDSGRLPHYPYQQVISADDKQTIGIAAIRELEHFLSLRVPGRAAHNRVVIIEDSHLMTIEAQNALLKLLEEPPAGTVFILTAGHSQALLPTIRSRVHSIDIVTPGTEETATYFSQGGFDTAQVRKVQVMSGGLPGLMSSLLAHSDHPLLAATEKARQLLSQTAYERQLAIDELSKNRPLLLDTLSILQHMAHLSLQTATGPPALRWQKVLEASYRASEALADSAQPKLVLLDLLLSL